MQPPTFPTEEEMAQMSLEQLAEVARAAEAWIAERAGHLASAGEGEE